MILFLTILCILFLTAGLTVFFYYNYRQKQSDNNLNTILNAATKGVLQKTLFEEGELTPLQIRLLQYLTNLQKNTKTPGAEKRKIETLLNDIAEQSKTRIAGLQVHGDILAQQNTDSNLQGHVTEILQQTEELRMLISALVLNARLETGNLELHANTNALSALFKNLNNQIAAKAQEKQQRLEFEASDIVAVFDAKWTTQALYYILENAVKYTPNQGYIRVSAVRETTSCRIDIEDSGIGIPPQERHEVFEKFYRGTNVVANTNGAGMGLFIAREIVARQGGYINVKAEIERGATVSVILPV